MNGLKVIELMQQGKKMKNATTAMVYWIEDGRLRASKLSKKGTFDQTELVAGFKFPFNSQWFEEYIEPKSLIGWERVEEKDKYFTVNSLGTIEETLDFSWNIDSDRYNRANYFSTKEKAEEIEFKQTLFRKLQRFSDENVRNEIDWNNDEQAKWSIAYSHGFKTMVVDHHWNRKEFGQVYFSSKGVAEKAIELFHDELIKYFTHDWGGENE